MSFKNVDETKKDNVIFTDWNRSWPSYGVLVSVPARLHTKSSVHTVQIQSTVVVAYVCVKLTQAVGGKQFHIIFRYFHVPAHSKLSDGMRR